MTPVASWPRTTGLFWRGLWIWCSCGWEAAAAEGGGGGRRRRVGVRRLVYGGAAIGGRDERPKFGLFAGGDTQVAAPSAKGGLAPPGRPDYRGAGGARGGGSAAG